MGLSAASTKKNAADYEFKMINQTGGRTIALAGNPNVGKSTVFNALTGLNQHTGNWPGKTVASARGICRHADTDYIFADLPGTYSLTAHSAEEEVARDFLLFGGADAAVVVCDAICLERNLNLVLQTMEILPRVAVCVNLMDEAEKKGIRIDLEKLENELGIPVTGTSARAGKGLSELIESVRHLMETPCLPPARKVRYPVAVEQAITLLEPALKEIPGTARNSRFWALRLLEGDQPLIKKTERFYRIDLLKNLTVTEKLGEANAILSDAGITPESLRDRIVSCIVLAAEEIRTEAAPCPHCPLNDRDRKLDRILTSRRTGIPIMLALLCGIFWLTITGANVPSQLLASGLFWVQNRLTDLFHLWGTPDWLHGALVLGVYRVLAWVVSVMLPPMAIFFPLFTLLEDFGYLPRVAFALDHRFKKAKACGKQALTLWIG